VRTLVWAAIVVGLSVGIEPGSAAPGPEPSPAVHTIAGLSGQEREVLDWALGLYEDAGLDLPGVRFLGHDAFDACRGGGGLFRDEDGQPTIHICGDHPRKFDESLFLHELAHAWDFANLDPSQRADFAELRGVTEWWGGGDHDWDELGAEHAAEIVVWALRDGPMAVYTIPDAGCDDLHAGYVALTGREPLHGYRDRC
jgi:hypothetical protein